MYDICIIGAGVVGSAIAREASKYKLKTILVEKESDVAEGISKGNSGVLHAGFNVPPNTLKAKFNVEGLEYFPKLCYDLDVHYDNCKKLVVANNEAELDYLKKLMVQGEKNNCKGLSLIDEKKIKEIEPKVTGKYAIYSEKTAVVLPYELTIGLAENAFANGVEVLLNNKVTSVEKTKEYFTIKTDKNKVIDTKIVINSAGVYSDKIASMAGSSTKKIYPVRGEYYIIDNDDAKNLVSTAIYPVPPSDGKSLGIHLTPTINGNILIGPSAEYIVDKEDVENTSYELEQLKKEAFHLLPDLKKATFIKNYSGIRTKLISENGKIKFEDYIIEESKEVENLINLIGIESPGLTSAPAIARYVMEDIIGKKHKLEKNEKFNPIRKGIKRGKFLSQKEKTGLYKKDKNWGEIICRCEQVTKAEIIQAINNPLGVKTLNGIKKRTHSMMGRCQGGFCVPKISEILTEEIGMKPSEVRKSNHRSYLYEKYED
ncbi:MAG: NAD(P)/FAD-dependent oxidoreductase [Candidatus Marinimicrobia bacterium]|nr:NAD(P)/FAD-dependent oxidoreductase [Candidatus Neomarinimicrobiota bacterium]